MRDFKMLSELEAGVGDGLGRKSSTGVDLEHRFEASEWGGLTVEQRIRRCHLMAEQAQELAKAAPTEIAETYLRIARDWRHLAMEMKKAGPGPQTTL